MPKLKAITYRYRGMIERARGGVFRWRVGYSEDSPEGRPYYPWMTVAECRDDAKAQGGRAVFDRDCDPVGAKESRRQYG